MSDRSRRKLGMFFGLLMGLSYGLVSVYINVLVLPGIPLYQENPGRLGIVALFALGGIMMGLVTAWTTDAIPGVIASALLTTILHTMVTIQAALAVPGNVMGLVTILLLTFLPRAVLLLPVSGLLRWVLYDWETQLTSVNFSIPRLVFTVALLWLLALAGGALSLYPRTARIALQKTHIAIQQGMRSGSTADLPAAIQSVEGFRQGARGAYSLMLSDNPDLLPIPRPMAAYDIQEYAVFVLFENGYHFGCVYTPPGLQPYCGNY